MVIWWWYLDKLRVEGYNREDAYCERIVSWRHLQLWKCLYPTVTGTIDSDSVRVTVTESVFTPRTRTRQDCLLLSCPCSRCELNWRQVKTVCDWKFRNSFVQSRNAVWTESCLVLKCVHTADKTKLFCVQYIESCQWLLRTQFTPPTRHYKTVLSCPCSRCELAMRVHGKSHQTRASNKGLSVSFGRVLTQNG